MRARLTARKKPVEAVRRATLASERLGGGDARNA